MITHPNAPDSKDRRLILYVEDNVDIRRAYALILRRAGFRVAEANNGVEGVERALELSPDLVLMDLALPVVDGYEATARLKHNPRTRDIPVLALSAYPLDPERGLRCDAYIVKPMEGTEVVRHVLHYLARARRAALQAAAQAVGVPHPPGSNR